MSEKKEEIMTKKERKKEEKRKAKAYIKAQYNYRVGYIFKAIKQFLKQNFVYYIKKYKKPLLITLLVLSLIFIVLSINKIIKGNEINDDLSNYQHTNKVLQSKSDSLKADLKQENKKIDSASISTQSGVKRAKGTIDKVFNGMYQYESSSEYRENRESNLQYFENPKAKWIDKIYSNDKDSDGNSQIKTLGLQSDLNSTDIYTESVTDTSKKIVPFKVITSYTGYINDVSSEYSTRTHYTTYEVDVDTSNNKITKMKKINTVKINNDIS